MIYELKTKIFVLAVIDTWVSVISVLDDALTVLRGSDMIQIAWLRPVLWQKPMPK